MAVVFAAVVFAALAFTAFAFVAEEGRPGGPLGRFRCAEWSRRGRAGGPGGTGRGRPGRLPRQSRPAHGTGGGQGGAGGAYRAEQPLPGRRVEAVRDRGGDRLPAQRAARQGEPGLVQ